MTKAQLTFALEYIARQMREYREDPAVVRYYESTLRVMARQIRLEGIHPCAS